MNKGQAFISSLLNWFEKNKRSLPFRMEKDPYKIWISEIMAQQTQIDTLIPYYQRFIQHFPTIESLAEAEEETVLKYWEGLGYYSRARNLHKAARIIKAEYHGIFPKDPKKIIKLPGIGPYTCGAIASIAFNLPVPAVDGNVLRVIARLKNWVDDIAQPQTKKKITDFLQEIMPEQAGNFNEGLMELGAIICTPKNPQCDHCPLCQYCLAHSRNNVNQIPFKSKKAKQKQLDLEVGLVYDQNKIYIIKRPPSGLLANLWSFPAVEADKFSGQAIFDYLKNKGFEIENSVSIGKSRHIFTHIIWNMTVYRVNLQKPYQLETKTDREVFATLEEIQQNYPLPTAFSKLLKL